MSGYASPKYISSLRVERRNCKDLSYSVEDVVWLYGKLSRTVALFGRVRVLDFDETVGEMFQRLLPENSPLSTSIKLNIYLSLRVERTHFVRNKLR